VVMLEYLELKSCSKIMTTGQMEKGDCRPRCRRLVNRPVMDLDPEAGHRGSAGSRGGQGGGGGGLCKFLPPTKRF
jgi:hypothetical protein